MLLSVLHILESAGIQFHNRYLSDFSAAFARKEARWTKRQLKILGRCLEAARRGCFLFVHSSTPYHDRHDVRGDPLPRAGHSTPKSWWWSSRSTAGLPCGDGLRTHESPTHESKGTLYYRSSLMRKPPCHERVISSGKNG